MATGLPGQGSWNVELIRLTAFHQLGTQNDDHGWWEKLVGTQPDSKTTKPREGGYEIVGQYGGGLLVHKADSVRFDWHLGAAMPTDLPPAAFPIVGPLPEVLKAFSPVALKWLEDAPELHRLAFGAVLTHPADSHESSYEVLGRHLPAVKIDPQDSRDFLYQINRPRNLVAFGGLKVNRLSKWLAIKFRPFIMTGSKMTAMAKNELYAVRLELDINTDAERDAPLPLAQGRAIFEKLIEMSCEIVDKGDIK